MKFENLVKGQTVVTYLEIDNKPVVGDVTKIYPKTRTFDIKTSDGILLKGVAEKELKR